MKQEFVLRVLLYCTELGIPKWESLCAVQLAAIHRNDTTRCRHLRKKFPRFCDFLLTDFSHGLILPFQIRGTWKRQRDRVGEVVWSGYTHETCPVSPKKRARSEAPRS